MNHKTSICPEKTVNSTTFQYAPVHKTGCFIFFNKETAIVSFSIINLTITTMTKMKN